VKTLALDADRIEEEVEERARGVSFVDEKQHALWRDTIAKGYETWLYAGITVELKFFVDFTSAEMEPGKVAEDIGRLDGVLNVEFSEAKFEGLIVDDLHFPLQVLGKRSIVIGVETVGDMFGKIYPLLGKWQAYYSLRWD